MAGSKQKALTKIDNNYQINLRYPDINDFLKDTFFSLQDNQTIERTLLANPRLVSDSARNVHTIVVAGYSVQVLLSNLTIYGFSPDQELFYDFRITPEIFGAVLGDFTASRTNEDARLQFVQSLSLTNSETVANFSITVSSKKIADLLTELFTLHATELKAELELSDDFSLLAYVLDNLFSLSFVFLCSYRLQLEGEYQAGFRVPAELSYLVPSLLKQTAVESAKISTLNYSPRVAATAPQLSFRATYNLTGELQLAQISNLTKYVDSTKFSVVKSETPQDFKSEFRTADYVWSTISGAVNTPPLISYNYTFAVQNSVTKYAGTFAAFQSPAVTTGSLTLKVSDYAVQLRKYKESSTNTDKFAVGVSFAVSNSNSKQTALSTLFSKLGTTTVAPNLFLQIDLLDPRDKTRATVPSPSFERFVALTTINPTRTYTVNASTLTTLSGCFLYTSANTDVTRGQFSKITQRVISTYSGLPSFASEPLGVVVPQVDLSVSASNPQGLLTVNLQWVSLSAGELAALHQLTVAGGVQVSLLDSFMNVLAVTDKTYGTNNKLTRPESPLVDPSFVYCAEIASTKTLLDTSYKNPISQLLTSVQRNVMPILRVLSGPTVAINRFIDYTTPEFNLRDNIYCIAQWTEKSLNGQTTVMRWSSVLHKPTEAEITITGSSISINPAQKISIARSLIGRYVTRLPEVYSIYVLLPWTTVRDVGTTSSIVRSNLVSGKYTYAYAIKV